MLPLYTKSLHRPAMSPSPIIINEVNDFMEDNSMVVVTLVN